MRFLIHGTIAPEIATALKAHGHTTHTTDELLADHPDALTGPSELLAALAKKQWCLLTTDADLVHKIFEQKIASTGIIVLLIDAADAATQSTAIDRLFERYKRLTPKRMYTVTPNRVKIRQMPGTFE